MTLLTLGGLVTGIAALVLFYRVGGWMLIVAFTMNMISNVLMKQAIEERLRAQVKEVSKKFLEKFGKK